MYFFFHLLVGVATGLFLSEIFRSRRWFFPVAIGSILPDLIDKPIGIVIFPEAIGNGRIIGHSLLFILILLIIAVLLWKYRGTIAGFGLPIGALVHQILDSMWTSQASWFYPLYGPFPRRDYSGFFPDYFSRSLEAPQEWLALSLLILLGVLIGAHVFARYHRLFASVSRITWPVLTFIGTVTLGLGIGFLFDSATVMNSWLSSLAKGGDPLVFTLALIWCGVVFVYLPLHRLNRARKSQ